MTLAAALERESSLRNRMWDPKDGGSITRWPMKGERVDVGIPSVKGMVLNIVALEATAR